MASLRKAKAKANSRRVKAVHNSSSNLAKAAVPMSHATTEARGVIMPTSAGTPACSKFRVSPKDQTRHPQLAWLAL